MKKTNYFKFCGVLFSLAISSLTGCTNSKPKVTCKTGTYLGMVENGVSAFKGIHYAKAPIGDLRWKAPVPVDESNERFDATRFGKSALQTKADSEQASMNPEGLSEDCLTLNIWTKDLKKKNKPVMFWIHGGAYAYGGTSDPLYNGKFIVNEHPDVLVVTANYRIGSMGFIDFSGIKGCEEYKTSGYNGLLDQIEALKWVNKNIEAFGGDPNNVTIFGESAGGGSVTQLLVSEIDHGEGNIEKIGDGTLFQHAIAESGSLNFGMTHERYKQLGAAEKLMERADVDTVSELAHLSEEEIRNLYLGESEDGIIADIAVTPLLAEDSITGKDPYDRILKGYGKNVDLIIGTTKDENRYFIDDMCDPALKSVVGTPQYEPLLEKKLGLFEYFMTGLKVDNYLSKCDEVEKANAQAFLEIQKDKESEEIWQKTALMNEYGFRGPAIKVAENHYRAGGTGKTYMYYFQKKNTNFDWIGACHASELSYVFHNLEDEQFSGKVIEKIADQMCGAWTNFAINHTPTYGEVTWPEYDDISRKTMFFNDDATFEVVSDPMKTERELIASSLRHYVNL